MTAPPTPSRYTFTAYNPDWPAAFDREAARLRTLLGGLLVEVHHIGSTSVPGLAAKPIIDLLPLVGDIHAVDAVTDRFTGAGYRAWGEYGLPGRRYFTRDRDGVRTHNIHIYQADDPDVERHLAFPAFLRAHPDACDAYAAVKREAFARHPADIAAYCDAKNDWIKQAERLALAWYGTSGRAARPHAPSAPGIDRPGTSG